MEYEALWGVGEVHAGFWWGKIPLWKRERHRWEDNIKIDLQEIGGSRGLG